MDSLQHQVPIQHAARQVADDDYRRFTHILAADEANLCSLEQKKPRNATAEIKLWGSYLDNEPIQDPYYGGTVRRWPHRIYFVVPTCSVRQRGFEECYQQCVQLSNAFLDEVVGKDSQSSGV